ncbi:MAG: indole-3-glycerol phosphate synthase TrpC [Rhizobiales bacterium]|nr:indole-3-glycerol phosphate synthase TrpC [Hyphomicrobiales bacterium]
MNSILKKISEYKRQEVDKCKLEMPLPKMIKMASDSNNIHRPFSASLKEKLSINITPLICEIKKASPSRGIIREDFDVEKIAIDYSQSGATCISVLTDYPSFMGKNEYLKIVRNSSPLPILRKDFFLDPYQVYETKYLGGDCILIILAMIDDITAKTLYETAEKIGLESIFEVHDEDEFDRAVKLNAKIIGINNRDLHTFKTDINNTIKLAGKFNKGQIIISESGIFNISDINLLKQHGVQSFLIGESIMKSDNIQKAIRDLLND